MDQKLTVGSLFAGIGGMDLGLEAAGMKVAWQVEKDEWCRSILKKHWPNVPQYGDVKEFNYETTKIKVDVIAGGPPCQGFSYAGKRKGKDDDRYLWPEMFRVIQEYKPTWVIFENVNGIDKLALDQVCSDLENQDFEVLALGLPAASVDAPHRRDRRWVIGYANGKGESIFSGHAEMELMSENETFGDSNGELVDGTVLQRKGGRQEPTDTVKREAKSGVCGVDDGLSSGVAGLKTWPPLTASPFSQGKDSGRVRKIRALGNSVVPQVVEQIGQVLIRAHYYKIGE